MFLSSASFFSLYPKGKVIGQGKYAKVYDSGNYVIKETTCLNSFLQEVNIYASIQHENMVPLKHLCQEEDKFYLCLGKGEKIVQALKERKINIDTIHCHLFSFLSYLHGRGYVHGDIKQENVVYYKGKACMIDFGLSQRCVVVDGQYKYFSINQSLLYRDPEMQSGCFNPQSCELYALARLMSILQYKNNAYDYFHYFPSYMSYLSPYYTVLHRRKGIACKVKEEEPIPYKYSQDHRKAYLYLLSLGSDAQVIFMAIDMLNRLPLDYIKENSKVKDVYNLCHAYFLNSNNKIENLGNIINCLEGKIYHLNYWDYAPDGTSLPYILGDVMNGPIEKGKIRKVKNISNVSKFTTVKEEKIDENKEYDNVSVHSTTYRSINVWSYILKNKTSEEFEGNMMAQLDYMPESKELLQIIEETADHYKLSKFIHLGLLPLDHPLCSVLKEEEKYFLIVENVKDIPFLNINEKTDIKIILFLAQRFGSAITSYLSQDQLAKCFVTT